MVHRNSSVGHGAARCIAVPGLGRKFWMITSWTWPWCRWLDAIAARASRRSARVSPIPTSRPVVKGIPASPAASRVTEPPRRGLVGRGAVGGQVRVERLDHHPLAGRDLAQPGQGLAVQGACVGMGQEAGLLQHRPARGRQIVDSRRVTVALEPPACHRIPILGSLPEREESLMATGGPTGTGDVQHVFDRQVGGVQPGRCLGEGAVATAVAAQHGEGDEHLGREGDPVAVGRVTDPPGEVLQQGQRRVQQVLIGPRRRRRGRGCRGGAGVGGHRRHLTGGARRASRGDQRPLPRRRRPATAPVRR